jgi:hypothetical protein
MCGMYRYDSREVLVTIDDAHLIIIIKIIQFFSQKEKISVFCFIINMMLFVHCWLYNMLVPIVVLVWSIYLTFLRFI